MHIIFPSVAGLDVFLLCNLLNKPKSNLTDTVFRPLLTFHFPSVALLSPVWTVHICIRIVPLKGKSCCRLLTIKLFQTRMTSVGHKRRYSIVCLRCSFPYKQRQWCCTAPFISHWFQTCYKTFWHTTFECINFRAWQHSSPFTFILWRRAAWTLYLTSPLQFQERMDMYGWKLCSTTKKNKKIKK